MSELIRKSFWLIWIDEGFNLKRPAATIEQSWHVKNTKVFVKTWHVRAKERETVKCFVVSYFHRCVLPVILTLPLSISLSSHHIWHSSVCLYSPRHPSLSSVSRFASQGQTIFFHPFTLFQLQSLLIFVSVTLVFFFFFSICLSLSLNHAN